MAKAPVVTELPLQSVRFLFGTMVDLRMLPQVLEQTGRAEIGEFKLVAHFPADEKAANKSSIWMEILLLAGDFGIWLLTNKFGFFIILNFKGF